ncbi:MAG: hypothetical protein DSY80_07165 [Desulfocapsa sp.]|nr:MAG: hypothetical protein DSY80_07165 [Desulfocapsa sp.]
MAVVRKKVVGAQIWLFEKDRRPLIILLLVILLLAVLNFATLKKLWESDGSDYDGRYKKATQTEQGCLPTGENWPDCQFKHRQNLRCHFWSDPLGCLKGE